MRMVAAVRLMQLVIIQEVLVTSQIKDKYKYNGRFDPRSSSAHNSVGKD